MTAENGRFLSSRRLRFGIPAACVPEDPGGGLLNATGWKFGGGLPKQIRFRTAAQGICEIGNGIGDGAPPGWFLPVSRSC